MLWRAFQMSQYRAIADQCSLDRSLELRMTKHVCLAHQLMNTFSVSYCWNLLLCVPFCIESCSKKKVTAQAASCLLNENQCSLDHSSELRIWTGTQVAYWGMQRTCRPTCHERLCFHFAKILVPRSWYQDP